MSTLANNDVIHVALAFCDPKGTYCRHAAVVMASIFENTSNKVCVHIIHDDTLTNNNREKLEKITSTYRQTVNFLNVENMFNSNKIDAQRLADMGARGMLFRLLIPDIIHEEKIIYLDCDIVVTLDISELWQIPLKGCAVAVVRDTASKRIAQCQRGQLVANEVWNLLRVRSGE